MEGARGAVKVAVTEAQRYLSVAADRADFYLYRLTTGYRPWQLALGSLLTAWLLARVLTAVQRQWRLFCDKGEGQTAQHASATLLYAV